MDDTEFTYGGVPADAGVARGPEHRKNQGRFVIGVLQARIANEKTGQPGPACCIEKGFYWDEAIVYELQRKWRDEARPTFMNGPVVKIGARLESAPSVEALAHQGLRVSDYS
jgi:hypothetical protein